MTTATTAIDPVWGTQVQIANAPTMCELNGRIHYFCSDHRKERFVTAPERYVVDSELDAGAIDAAVSLVPAPDIVAVELGSRRRGSEIARNRPAASVELASPMEIDPVCHMEIEQSLAAATRVVATTTYLFCCIGCAEAFDAEPERYFQLNH